MIKLLPLVFLAGCQSFSDREPLKVTQIQCAPFKQYDSQASSILTEDNTYGAVPDALRSCTDALHRCNAQ